MLGQVAKEIYGELYTLVRAKVKRSTEEIRCNQQKTVKVLGRWLSD